MTKMKIVMTPNPYRDKQFKTALQAKKILEECGAAVSMCLPFDVDRDFELPKSIDFQDLHREIKTADLLICCGGDGTILHSSKIATAHNLPVLGVNIETSGSHKPWLPVAVNINCWPGRKAVCRVYPDGRVEQVGA